MKTKRIRGFIDPITLGFILALFGTATIVTMERHKGDRDTVGPTTATQQISSTQSG